jgi:hypothetical protein
MIRLIYSCLALTIIFLSELVCASHQTGGVIYGVVIDEETKETIIGASVMVRQLGIGAATDIDGRYLIRDIPEGTYVITVSYVGYNTVTITDLTIRSGERTELDFVMNMGEAELDAITVTAYRENSSIASVVMDVRNSYQVSNGVSRQQIALSQDSNAAEVMQRVPGVTIADNRFVFIRGLSERYNNVVINNSTAPSTEVDKRTFSFDLISSSSLERMMIFKSGDPSLPGDFAGGLIKLYTVDNVDSNFLKFNFGMGYRSGTTGRTFLKSKGSGTDFIGFDSGFRQLPSGFADSNTLQASPRNSEIRINSAHLLPNNFSPSEQVAYTDYALGISFGRNATLGNKPLSFITTIDYSAGYQYYQRDFNRYFEWENRTQPILTRFDFVDDTYRLEQKIGIMTNWKLRLNNRSYLSFKNLFNQIGEDETIIRNGMDFIQRPDDNLRNYLLGYRSRTIYTGQIEGYHEWGSEFMQSILWVAGGSFLREDEPDLRRFRTFQPKQNPEAGYIMQLPPSSNLFDTGRYFGDMNEYSLNQKLDYTLGLTGLISELKTGFIIDYRDREFSSRYISYLYPGFFNSQVREELIRLPLSEIFSNENIRSANGFVIEEGTRPIDSYQANSLTAAAYISTRIPFSFLTLNGGVRTEYNIQRLSTRDDFEVVEIENPVLSVLPFFNSTFHLSDRYQLRLGYGRTINRPEFRELAPFVFYDYKMDAGRAGNPNLVPAAIDNIDLRLEFYPRLGETISIGGFLKYFDKPIETKTTVVTENPQFGYINADQAISYGAEIEIRKSFQGISNSGVLDRFSVNLNGSIIHTEVDLGESAFAQDKIRPLQGQSPYIINAALYYDHLNNLNGSLVYNIIGPRIFSVGDVLFPTIYEMPRHSIDLTVTKQVTVVSSIQLGVRNLLNSAHRYFQDSDRNGSISTNVDHSIISYKTGQQVNITFSYEF